MNLNSLVKTLYRKGRKIFNSSEKHDLIKFKKEIWQTEEISRSFVKNTDPNFSVSADLMDREVNEYFLENCKVDDQVLDIGCGHGIVSEYLARNGISVTGMDISEKLLNEFRNRLKGENLDIKIIKGDAYNIPFENEYFDVIVARMFLPHFPDWPVVLKEMSRVTKPGGKMLVHFSSKENTVLGKKIGVRECHFASTPNQSNPWTFYAETDNVELVKVAKSAGLKLKKRVPVSFFLHNRIIGYQLGTEKYNRYMEKAQEFFSDQKIRDFVLWFDKEIVGESSPALSHFNIITFNKL